METLIQIFSPMIGFLYHCFDRIVINGNISMLSRPEHIVYFFRTAMPWWAQQNMKDSSIL